MSQQSAETKIKPTHYAYMELGNESTPNDDWAEETACNVSTEKTKVVNNWNYVTCKNCLKNRK